MTEKCESVIYWVVQKSDTPLVFEFSRLLDASHLQSLLFTHVSNIALHDGITVWRFASRLVL